MCGGLARGAMRAQRLLRIAGGEHVAMGGDQRQDGHAWTAGVLELVDQEPLEPLGDRLGEVTVAGQQAAELEHHLAFVQHSELEHDRVVTIVDLAELDLAEGLLTIGATCGSALHRPSAVAEIRRADPLGLERIDALEQAGEQAGGIAADLVPAQRQIIEPVEHQGEPVGGGGRLEEGIDAGLERVVPQHPLGEPRPRLDPELLVNAGEPADDSLPKLGLVGGALGDHRDPLHGRATGRQGGDPPSHQLRPARARRAEQERRTLPVRQRALEAVLVVAFTRHRLNRSEAANTIDADETRSGLARSLQAHRRPSGGSVRGDEVDRGAHRL